MIYKERKIIRDHFPIKQETTSFLDRVGFTLLLMLINLVPFHFFISTRFAFYREFFFAFFLALWLLKFIFSEWKLRPLHIRSELLLLVSFPLLLIPFALFDPGISLYASLEVASPSQHLQTISPNIYILRNAFLYIPMVMYFSIRGLSEKEISLLALTTVLIAPLSIYAFLLYHGILTSTSPINLFITLGTVQGYGLQYNTYVPYLTFPALSAIFLLFNKKYPSVHGFVKFVYRCMIYFILIFIIIYTMLSTSRQSLLFILICFVFFFLQSKLIRLNMKFFKMLLFFIVFAGFFLIFVPTEQLGNRILKRYSSFSGLITTPRIVQMIDGLTKLDIHEYFIGAGLSSVIFSGPHNDYIRWMQRVGLFVMLFSFWPFFLIFYKEHKAILFFRNNSLRIYLFLSIFFILYHSFFSYPREDAYQAPFCFIGILMWLAIGRFELSTSPADKYRYPIKRSRRLL